MSEVQGGDCPRLFRRAGGFVLAVGDRLLDLSAYWREHGIRASLIDLFAEGWFTREELEPRLAKDDWNVVSELSALKVPIPPRQVGKILALGKNFRAHAAEFDEEVPDEPLFFNKLPETLSASGATVRIGRQYTERIDHEAELAVLISRNGSCFPPEDAASHIAAFSVANDLTARTRQFEDREKGFPWFRAKNMDGFCPLGPCLVPRDFFDPTGKLLTGTVNGEVRQSASLDDLVVGIDRALAYLSTQMTLRAGDLVLMGTPAGVGPLVDGDVVVAAIEGIGELETRISRPE